MRKILLMSSALVVSGLLSGVAEAACIQTPSCSSLGYTSSQSCNGGVKCPFGNAWNCTAAGLTNKITEVTNKITEITNKITTIEEKITVIEENGGGSGTTTPDYTNCTVGAILYSDMSCDPKVIASKKPIGVVFDRTEKLAIGLEESKQYWSSEYFNVLGWSYEISSSAFALDWRGKNNTRVVLEYCKTNGKRCPAFEYVNSYKTEGTLAGDWYLPALGELNAIYGNKDVLNITLGKIGGTKLGTYYYWSSSESSPDGVAWALYFSSGIWGGYPKVGSNFYVRPVLAF